MVARKLQVLRINTANVQTPSDMPKLPTHIPPDQMSLDAMQKQTQQHQLPHQQISLLPLLLQTSRRQPPLPGTRPRQPPVSSSASGLLDSVLTPGSGGGGRESVVAAKTKRAARKSPAPRTTTTDAQAFATCTRCHRTFRARIGLDGHLPTQCTDSPTIQNSTSTSANPPSDSPTLTPGINSISPAIIKITSQYSARVTPTTTATTTISDGDSLLNCLHCDRHSPHASAWSVTCESLVQRRVNQCLELQHTAEIAASTALTIVVRTSLPTDAKIGGSD
ncbi:unnamed protein product [Schistocephalus solidus]|uniref:C2H2-type domain-containing protein n=1 Tax=Schistocephalus solidus TaxID=70667 RepID=A0A183SI87_SCHSO|nr:unnamed protein product [Schistocephalus solidus]